MNINEFMKKFLPDYEAKIQEFYEGYKFREKYFPEALQNFVDGIYREYRKSDLRIIKTLLPKHYTCKLREKGIFCKSDTGIPDVKGNTEWQTFTERVGIIFGDRVMEIFHHVCSDHLSFTVYLEPPKINEL
jgi:hypothetical protein